MLRILPTQVKLVLERKPPRSLLKVNWWLLQWLMIYGVLRRGLQHYNKLILWCLHCCCYSLNNWFIWIWVGIIFLCIPPKIGFFFWDGKLSMKGTPPWQGFTAKKLLPKKWTSCCWFLLWGGKGAPGGIWEGGIPD